MKISASLLKLLFEKDAVTTICVLVLIAVFIMGVYLYRKHIRTDKTPDFLGYDGYYKVALTATGYAATDRNNLLRTLSQFYYLRSEPFSIEVSIDEIAADDGKKYRALATAIVIMPEDRIDFVCRLYFSDHTKSVSNAEVMAAVMNRKINTNTSSAAADILSGQRRSSGNSDELIKQIISGNVPSSIDREKRKEKTNCDAEVDMDLTIAFSSTLKKLVKEQAGTLTEEEMKKRFLGQAMLCAMETGHAVTSIQTFNIIENKD